VVIATGVVTTLAGTAGSSGTADGTGPAARFDNPIGITTDGTSLYVADYNSHTIRKVVIASRVVTTLAGTAGSSGIADGTGSAARFFNPDGITTDGTNLYVVDHNNHTIRKVVILTGVVTTLAGTAGSSGTADGTGLAAMFNYPDSITTDGTNLYVTDESNQTIRKVVIATGVVTTLAGTAGSSGTADGTGSAARFDSPDGITTDGTSLYVADTSNQTIRKVVIATGVVTTLAGTAGSSGIADGTGPAARFDNPIGITTDGTSLYVGDYNNQTIRKVVIATGVVTTLAGTTPGSADGTSSAARFDNPIGITTDGTSLYVADYNNHTIRKVVIASRVVTTLAGTAGSSGTADGTGSAARFDNPDGITTDGTNVYVADYNNHTIRKVVIATGVVTTLAGTAGSSGTADGTGPAARFSGPIGITTDGTNLYVGDYYSIRKVVIATGVVTTPDWSNGQKGSTDGTGSAIRFNGPWGVTTDGTSLYVADHNNHTIRKVE
jgi:sugar lactone lactonase YvrE